MKGQISITTVIGWGIAIAIATLGGYLAQSRTITSNIENVKQENVSTIQRVATVEEAIRSIREDQKEMKADIKELLRRQDIVIQKPR